MGQSGDEWDLGGMKMAAVKLPGRWPGRWLVMVWFGGQMSRLCLTCTWTCHRQLVRQLGEPDEALTSGGDSTGPDTSG